MKKIFCSILLSVLLLQHSVYAEVTPLPASFYAMKDEAAKKLAKDPASNCYANIVPAYDLEFLEFMKFLEENFQNKSSTSSLSNIAISRFSEFKAKLKSLYQSLSPGGTGGGESNLSEDALAGYLACDKIKDTYTNLGKEKMIEYIKNNQAQKRTTIMVEKYKSINSELNTLNVKIARMYSYFMTFKEKLPWFTSECIRI